MTVIIARTLDHAPALVLAACIAALGAVFAMEHLGGLIPCPLCITQRWPYGVAMVFAAMALAPGAAGTRKRLLLAGCAAAFLIGGAIGVYHTGVEQGWFEGPAACSAAPGRAGTVEALRAQLMATPVVRCDEIPWSLFGISLAGYNAILAAGLFVFSLTAALRKEAQAGP